MQHLAMAPRIAPSSTMAQATLEFFGEGYPQKKGQAGIVLMRLLALLLVSGSATLCAFWARGFDGAQIAGSSCFLIGGLLVEFLREPEEKPDAQISERIVHLSFDDRHARLTNADGGRSNLNIEDLDHVSAIGTMLLGRDVRGNVVFRMETPRTSSGFETPLHVTRSINEHLAQKHAERMSSYRTRRIGEDVAG